MRKDDARGGSSESAEGSVRSGGYARFRRLRGRSCWRGRRGSSRRDARDAVRVAISFNPFPPF